MARVKKNPSKAGVSAASVKGDAGLILIEPGIELLEPDTEISRLDLREILLMCHHAGEGHPHQRTQQR